MGNVEEKEIKLREMWQNAVEHVMKNIVSEITWKYTVSMF